MTEVQRGLNEFLKAAAERGWTIKSAVQGNTVVLTGYDGDKPMFKAVFIDGQIRWFD